MAKTVQLSRLAVLQESTFAGLSMSGLSAKLHWKWSMQCHWLRNSLLPTPGM